MTTGWFGEIGFSPVCWDVPQVEAPVGRNCLWCDEPIADGDTGYMVAYTGLAGHSEEPQHEFCALRSIVGGVNHQAGQCTCCGGDQPPDPPELTKREAAVAAATYFYRSKRPQRRTAPDLAAGEAGIAT